MTDQNQWQSTAWGTGQAPTPQAGPLPGGAQPQPQPQPAANPYGYAAPQPQPAYAAPVAAPPAKRRGWIVALVAVIAFFVLGLVSIGSCTAVMSSSMGTFSYETPSWTETVTGDTVGIINIDGTIQYDGTTSSPEGLKAQLDAAEANPHIKAVVLRVNSGGGVATAGEEMSRYVSDFSKPVVVSCASMDASAAYMISSQADYIFAAETSAVGSIGVIMQVTDLSGLYEKLGISVDNITSADSKDSSYGNRPLTEEERAYYQAQVDQINTVFIKTVAEGRGMSEDEVRALATGLTFTGIDGVENGLVDEIGTLEMAVDKACELAGVSHADTVYLQSSSSDLSRLLDIMGEQNDDKTTRALKELEDRVGLE
ncbi:signal peptide peptidase SppA [Adlercreutzia sp. R21]|uniref:signal peptide peptidase SppA n=1 Tax=Adlercreutzia wanghongyangiae TaxID=3111451 RepID=UPI002DBD5F69|nr:signal peptide peptidase SppA [Adlercreutzia sp. R21]MEC4184913.1 signal peptide peptidase SppA [Adlercreutzia sp. R21]